MRGSSALPELSCKFSVRLLTARKSRQLYASSYHTIKRAYNRSNALLTSLNHGNIPGHDEMMLRIIYLAHSPCVILRVLFFFLLSNYPNITR